MSLWSERLDNSAALIEARRILGSIDGYRDSTNDPTMLESIDRIEYVLGVLVSGLEDVDPRLITQVTLDTLQSHMANLSSYLASWQSGQGDAYLSQHAQNMLDNILTILTQIPQTPPSLGRQSSEEFAWLSFRSSTCGRSSQVIA